MPKRRRHEPRPAAGGNGAHPPSPTGNPTAQRAAAAAAAPPSLVADRCGGAPAAAEGWRSPPGRAEHAQIGSMRSSPSRAAQQATGPEQQMHLDRALGLITDDGCTALPNSGDPQSALDMALLLAGGGEASTQLGVASPRKG
eukprot:TRINITY_DN16501_c0_g1_i1.p4 TRINITY_DN16501_c0_g1~~TRINITY_DN16501_c0_g1_i1.p4  ORF type:complete len:142 (+),score=27.20 TRINITY_DN16501_c0_g1_i1:98-523(+)